MVLFFILIIVISVTSFELPESVIGSTNSKIQKSQNSMKVENEVATATATARAEAQKTIVEANAREQQILINVESQAKENKILYYSILFLILLTLFSIKPS